MMGPGYHETMSRTNWIFIHKGDKIFVLIDYDGRHFIFDNRTK
jgi:hypothetical protein